MQRTNGYGYKPKQTMAFTADSSSFITSSISSSSRVDVTGKVTDAGSCGRSIDDPPDDCMIANVLAFCRTIAFSSSNCCNTFLWNSNKKQCSCNIKPCMLKVRFLCFPSSALGGMAELGLQICLLYLCLYIFIVALSTSYLAYWLVVLD